MSELKKLSLGAINFLKAKDMSPGQTLSGKYMGSKQGRYTMEHKINNSDGTTVVNGTGQLDALLEQVAIGADVELKYVGKSTIQSGDYKGKEAHQFDVSASQTIEPSSAPIVQVASGSSSKLPF